MRLKLGSEIHEALPRGEGAYAIDGRDVKVNVSASAPPRFEARTARGRSSFFVVRAGDLVFAQIGPRAYSLRVVPRVVAAADAAESGALEAPMPGRVTRVNVSVGDSVTRGQELIVVEAMKMENALVAPNDGVVKSLTVKVGDMVAPGPALIVVEVERS